MPFGFTIELPPLPPPETPAGAPGLGFLIAYEDSETEAGWSTGVIEAIEEGCDGRVFKVKTRNGSFQVSRGMVFYWWPPGRRAALPDMQPRASRGRRRERADL